GSAVLALPACVVVALVALPIGVRWGAWPRRAAAPILAAGLAGVAAMLVNPYGPRLLVYPFDRTVASAFSPAIVEWGSPDFGAGEALAFRVLLSALLLVAIWIPRTSRDPFLLLAAAGWSFVALGSVRFLSIAGPLLVVALAPAISVAIVRWVARAQESEDATDPNDVGDPGATADGARRARGSAFTIAAVAIAGIVAAGWLIVDPQRQDAAIARRLPVAAVAALAASGCTTRLLPSYAWAGYVMWATGHSVGAYGNSADGPVSEQARVEAVVVDPRTWLDVHAVGAILMPGDGPLSHWLDEADGWRLGYRDGQATIHVRADVPDCPLSPTSAR
ncbi:MAG TPA: hypothetical protein VM408_07985, partial [Methylomirabilota bacterium]|nr:hypothetical protein [Methylomirabilota bacterium]